MANVVLRSKTATREFELQHALRILQAQDQTKKFEWEVESKDYEYKNGDLYKKKVEAKPEKLKD